MSDRHLINHFEKRGIGINQFDHFDLVQAMQNIPELQIQSHPKKKKIIQQFAKRCQEKIENKDKNNQNKQRSLNFIQRMNTFQSLRQQKLQALRFIQHNYDNKNRQLKYYPKVNISKATQKGRYWKDRDGFQVIQLQQRIPLPNSSAFYDSQSGHY